MEMIQKMILEETIRKEDLNLLLVTDDIDEAMTHIKTISKTITIS